MPRNSSGLGLCMCHLDTTTGCKLTASGFLCPQVRVFFGTTFSRCDKPFISVDTGSLKGNKNYVVSPRTHAVMGSIPAASIVCFKSLVHERVESNRHGKICMVSQFLVLYLKIFLTAPSSNVEIRVRHGPKMHYWETSSHR